MKRIIAAFVFSGVLGALAAQTDEAFSIVDKSRNRIQAETTSTRSRMIITAKDGSTSERLIDQYSKDGPKGRRQVIVFQRPAGVANTRFLTMENPGKGDDQWIFLPALGKVRRIAANEGSGSFMGTDLSYDDLSATDRDAALDDHRLLREEDLNGKPCYVIESVPKDGSFQYSKMVQWIDRANSAPYKIELYDRKGSPVKLLELLEFKDVQGRLTPMVTRMTTLGAGSSTSINVDIVKYDDPIPEAVFTPAFLETGRAR